MKKIFKKFFITAMLSIMILVGVSTTADAYTGYSFSLSAGERDWTGPVRKPDSLQWAGIKVTSNNIISADRVYARVRNYQRYYATEAVRITRAYKTYRPDYTIRRGVYGNYYYLYAQSDVYYARFSGSWEP